MERGWIKIYRCSLESPLFQNPKIWQFWCWCLLKASHQQREQMVGMQLVRLQPGEFITGRIAAAKELNMSEKTVRTCIKKLKNFEKIRVKTTNKFSILSVINWDSYQQQDSQKGQQRANKGPSKGHKQELQNVKKEKPSSKKNETEEKIYKSKRGRSLTGKRLDSFDRFWAAFGYKSGKADAADAWMDIPQLTDAMVDQICDAAEIENNRRGKLRADGRTPKMAQGWITGRRWEDDVYQAKKNTPEDFLAQY